MSEENGLMNVENEERSLTILEESRQLLLKIASESAIWAKVDKGANGFQIQGKLVPKLVGVITSYQPYIARFPEDGGAPEKEPYTDNPPPEWEPRCDIFIRVGGDIVVGISLPKSSFKYQFAKYTQFLENIGKRPEDVVTEIQTRMASNPQGSWAVCTFDLVENPKDEETVPFDVTPSEKPAPQSQTPSQWE